MGNRAIPNRRTNRPSIAYSHIWGYAIILCYLIVSLSACGKQKGDAIKSNIDSLSYTSLTTGIETLISDSGITRYKVIAEKWYTYEKPENLWSFPEGIYLEQFDTLYTIEASIEADTAYYYQDKKIWELRGNVFVLNREGQKFSGESLFWDEGKAEVYSHDPIQIERTSGELLRSQYGFKSNQSMTQYELYSSSGHIDVEDTVDPVPSDTTVVSQTDTLDLQLPVQTPRSE
ncbi:MAG: LPS export ABC transporter periplasmic protein LptC [Porphyromonas sp.]|nr:LPS export ABC transporter periplasmic protein LptC [Porphyromonas sp.]